MHWVTTHSLCFDSLGQLQKKKKGGTSGCSRATQCFFFSFWTFKSFVQLFIVDYLFNLLFINVYLLFMCLLMLFRYWHNELEIS